MSVLHMRLVPCFVVTVCLFGLGTEVRAQGCVASRMNAPGGPTDPQGNSYFLAKGQWQATFGFRQFHSHRHFVGSVEQNAENLSAGRAERDRSTTEVENWVRIPELAVSYAVSDRLSVTASLPILSADRKIPGSVFKEFGGIEDAPDIDTASRGISDISVVGRFWLGATPGHGTQNASVGVGFKLPTGQTDVQDDVTRISATGAPPVTTTSAVDQSIQPGDGGFGILAEVQGFKLFGPVTTFAYGSYLFNPRGTNGVATGRSLPGEEIMSVADQFAARIGVGAPLKFAPGLAVSLSARLEGVPVGDVFGSDEGFRRPGYSIAVEPGLSYSWKRTSISLSVPYLVRRVRNQSLADQDATVARGHHVQGDAAFADYIWVVGLSQRF